MKISKPWLFYIAGLITMATAYFGHVSSSSCEQDVTWPTYVYLISTLVFGIGLFLTVNKNGKSPIKAAIFSVLTILAILIAGIILATASQPDGIFHCYEF